MSKSTISERAVEYMADAMDKREETTDQEQNQTLRHLVQFAAREVARARREAIDACDVVLAGVRNGGARNAVKAVRARIIHASLPLLDDRPGAEVRRNKETRSRPLRPGASHQEGSAVAMDRIEAVIGGMKMARELTLEECKAERDRLAAQNAKLVERNAALVWMVKSGWGTARLLAVQYGAAASERAADEALAILAQPAPPAA